MFEYKRYKNILPMELVQKIRKKALGDVYSIQQDYFPDSTPENIINEYVAPYTAIHRILSFRFFRQSLFDDIRQFIEPVVRQHAAYANDTEFRIHPIYNMRATTDKARFRSDGYIPLLETQPHWDMAFGFFFHSIWVPLQEINRDSGGLSFFKNNEVLKHFEVPPNNKTKNQYSFDSYLTHADKVDPIIEKDMVFMDCSPGDIIVFSQRCLHAGIRGLKGPRLSFDFRLARKIDLDIQPPSVIRHFDEVNQHFDLSAANNLISIGDTLGAAKILKDLAKKTGNKDYLRLAVSLEKSRLSPHILMQEKTYKWMSEYSWVNELAS